MNAPIARADQLFAMMLGSALGDALGLPREGLTAARAARIFPGELQHALVGRSGYLSDDTEHMWMTALACIDAGDKPDVFERSLKTRLRWWLLRMPAGIGLATLRSILKLWLGGKAGVFSAGNGPAMRAPMLGAVFHDNIPRLREFVRISTRMTHTDPKAEEGALAIALAAVVASAPGFSVDALQKVWRTHLVDKELLALLSRAIQHAQSGEDVSVLVREFKFERGVSGYMYHTVPASVYCWLKHRGDFRGTLECVMKLGGDTDTVGAIAGALGGLSAGIPSIPRDWIRGMKDWPITTDRLRLVAESLVTKNSPRGVDGFCFGACQFVRNIIFIPIVLCHGFRRLLPPY